MRRGLRLLSVLAVLMVLGTACTEQASLGPPVSQSSADPGGPPATNAELAAKKKAAGIGDCPTSDPRTPVVDHGLPDVTLACLGGGRQVRLAGLRGRPMVISVWAQWCGPCRAEAPHLSEVAAGASGDVMFLGVDFDDPQPGYAIDFAQLSKWRYPQLVDQDKALAAPLNIIGPPQTFFVRPDGTIAYRQTGAFTSAQQIRDLAKQHLGVTL